jgi:hypothetical protein
MFVKNHLAISVDVFLSYFGVSTYVFLYCFGYYDFVAYFEVSSVFLVFFFLLMTILTVQSFLWLYVNFRIFNDFCEECHWYFDRDCIESVDHLG